MKLQKVYEQIQALVNHPVEYAKKTLLRWYEAAREQAYKEASQWENFPRMAAFYALYERAARLLSWSSVLIYPLIATTLGREFGLEYISADKRITDVAFGQWIAFTMVMLVVFEAAGLIYLVPIATLRNETKLVKHLKAVTITLGALMILSPALQVLPVYTWNLPLFAAPYVRLDSVLFLVGCCSAALSVVLIVTYRILTGVKWLMVWYQRRNKAN